jgi:two-component system NtrC family sensor kinase
MKKKIVIGFAVYSVALLLTGAYAVHTIHTSAADLDRMISLHQVETLREHSMLQIKRVQSDFALMNTRHARDFDTVVKNVIHMGKTVEDCGNCHHSPRGEQRLRDLKEAMEKYKNTLSRVLTLSANAERLAAEEDAAFRIGEELIVKIQDMLETTTSRLWQNTQKAMGEIRRTRDILYALVALGPLVSALLGFVFITGLSRHVNVLLQSTRKLKNGNLDHRVEGLKDEFGELAVSFNEMADSLKEQMRKMRDAERTLAKANQELKSAQEQMVRAETMAALGTLTSGISHELATPLGVILNMAQLTKQDAGENTALRKDLEVIEEEAGQAIKITRSLLGFARATKSHRESVSVNQVLEDLFKILEFQPAARSVQLIPELEPGLRAIRANAGQMRQVFLNIILNAVQAMPGGGELRVASRNRTDGFSDGVEVTVSDTGTGIPEEVGKKVFQPFFTTKDEGTGLGLAIVHGIVREHNGKIEVESEVGKGTTFTIFLPAGGGEDAT